MLFLPILPSLFSFSMDWFDSRDTTVRVNTFSKLTVEEMEAIKTSSGFTEWEIIMLENRFNALVPEAGRVTLDAFLRLPELNMPLSARIPKALGIAKVLSLDFRTFCKSLAPFHPRAAVEDKIDFLFNLYDEDEDGFISRDDLRSTLQVVAGESRNDELIEYAIEKVFTELNDDLGGKLSKEEFLHGLGGVDVPKLISFKLDEY